MRIKNKTLPKPQKEIKKPMPKTEQANSTPAQQAPPKQPVAQPTPAPQQTEQANSTPPPPSNSGA
jgi:hypothetical protein